MYVKREVIMLFYQVYGPMEWVGFMVEDERRLCVGYLEPFIDVL
jgi:hypothetical protein